MKSDKLRLISQLRGIADQLENSDVLVFDIDNQLSYGKIKTRDTDTGISYVRNGEESWRISFKIYDAPKDELFKGDDVIVEDGEDFNRKFWVDSRYFWDNLRNNDQVEKEGL